MPLLFVIAGLVSVAALGVFVVSIVVGTLLCITPRRRTAGIFTLLVPTTASVLAVASSWGLAFLCDSLSRGASAASFQRWQVMTLWAWPAGFVIGGVAGVLLGIAFATLLVRRQMQRNSIAKAADSNSVQAGPS